MAKVFSPLRWLVTEAFLITAKSIAKEGDAIRVAALPVAMIPKYGVASDQASQYGVGSDQASLGQAGLCCIASTY